MRPWFHRLPVIAAVCGALLLPVAPPALALTATQGPGAFCAILTVDEVKAAIGIPIKIAEGSSDTACTYVSAKDDGMSYYLSASSGGDTLQYWKDAYGDLKDVTIGDRPAAMAEDGRLLIIDDGSGVLMLQMDGTVKGLKKPAAIKKLGAAALTHVDAVPLPSPTPTAPPPPSFTGDADLAGLFPAQLGGQALAVQTIGGRDLVAMSNDPYSVAAMDAALAAIGKTWDDVSLGIGYNGLGSITALRIRGADASAVAQGLVPLLASSFDEPVQEPAEIAGRQVIKVTDGQNAAVNPQYLLPSGEVIWMVAATDPVLTEAIGALP